MNPKRTGPLPSADDIPTFTQFNVRMDHGLHKAINSEARRRGVRKQDILLLAMHVLFEIYPSPYDALLPSLDIAKEPPIVNEAIDEATGDDNATADHHV